jgi:hypothetical protein
MRASARREEGGPSLFMGGIGLWSFYLSINGFTVGKKGVQVERRI